MVDQSVQIIENRQISPDFYLLRFTWKAAWGVPAPGSFLELKVNDATAPLLRRPFAFSDFNSDKEEAAMIYQVRGTSTELLKQKAVGETVKILGPLGTTFDLAGNTQKIIAVGGGVGLGPILYAAKQFTDEGRQVQFVTGFRNSDLVPDTTLWDGLNATLCTDDGSQGFNGNVVQYLSTLDKAELEGATIMACGPTPMLRALHNFAKENGLTCEVSMEEMMACGIGACMGCVVETADGGMVRVCKDGPVFESELLKWN